jgi:two-component system chemotaxis response regulator CheY
MAKKILIVDDSSSLRTLVRLALEKAGYLVIEACDGQDATDKLDTAQPDLIVCDLNMPRMDGLEFARRVKESPQCRFTPLVMLTTTTDVKSKTAARTAGVSAWVPKPFEPKTLVTAIDRLCK